MISNRSRIIFSLHPKEILQNAWLEAVTIRAVFWLASARERTTPDWQDDLIQANLKVTFFRSMQSELLESAWVPFREFASGRQPQREHSPDLQKTKARPHCTPTLMMRGKENRQREFDFGVRFAANRTSQPRKQVKRIGTFCSLTKVLDQKTTGELGDSSGESESTATSCESVSQSENSLSLRGSSSTVVSIASAMSTTCHALMRSMSPSGRSLTGDRVRPLALFGRCGCAFRDVEAVAAERAALDGKTRVRPLALMGRFSGI